MSSVGFSIITVMSILFVLGSLVIISRKRTEKYNNNSGDYERIKKLQALVSLVNPEFADLKIFPGKESVTVDKKKIYICLKDPVTKEFYPFDVLIYVTLHEIAHVLSKSYSIETHNLEFEKNFQNLLTEAYKVGILQNEVVVPNNYCTKEKRTEIWKWLLK